MIYGETIRKEGGKMSVWIPSKAARAQQIFISSDDRDITESLMIRVQVTPTNYYKPQDTRGFRAAHIIYGTFEKIHESF